ncbi:MAG: hypothetical protein AAGD25_13780 [Cyanobacteria bacterium P01_F01_bin.150]
MNQKLGLEAPQNCALPQRSLGNLMPMFLTLIVSAAGHAYFVITFPAVARQFGFGDVQASLIMGLSALLLTVSEPLWGLICEHRGRWFMILIGAMGTSVFIGALAVGYQMGQLQWLALQSLFMVILATRLAQAAVSGGWIPSAQAVLVVLIDGVTQ